LFCGTDRSTDCGDNTCSEAASFSPDAPVWLDWVQSAMNNEEILANIKKYNFYHTIKLTDSISTPGNGFPHEAMSMRALRTIDLRGKRVLDIGCRDGKFSFEAERMGAAEVIAIDIDLSRAMVEFLIPFFNSKVKLHEINLLELTPDTFGKFDVVLFFCVLYHLRYPFWALKLIKDVLHGNGQLLIETAVLRDTNLYALLYCPTGAESPYENTSCTFFNEKGLRDTLSSIGIRVDSVEYVVRQSRARTLLSKLRTTLKNVAKSDGSPLTVDRAVFSCRVAKELLDADVLLNYWDKMHRH
jgi:2-polyprenyl-3-methyl-5-hydroxy-6-metoxy-1,4-benzoquinol methylase